LIQLIHTFINMI